MISTSWQNVLNARSDKRPTTKDLINNLFDSFIELKGDALYGDDSSIIGGVAYLKDLPITIIGQEKGKSTEEKIKHNFGMTHPEGYRKALRLMKQAEKFKRPIITIIDTPGAFPGIEAEERGQAKAIANNLFEMMTLNTPIISIVLGEGGSGGALALNVSDITFMLKNAIYSVISPEGFATILYKDAKRASNITDDMKITAKDLYEFGIIDKIIDEDDNLHINYNNLKNNLYSNILELILKYEDNTLLKNRYNKYKKF